MDGSQHLPSDPAYWPETHMRMVTRDDPSAFGTPRAATIVLLVLNCAMFGLCYAASNGASTAPSSAPTSA